MKKTCVICLLLILILSCAFSFVACADPIDPVVGYYKSTTPSSNYEWYFKINEDNTAIMYTVQKGTTEIIRQYEYTWSYNEATEQYRFVDISPGSNSSVSSYVLRNPQQGDSLDGLAANFETETLRYERYYDADWLQ